MSITRASVLAAALLVSTPCCAGLFPAPANRHELVTFDHVTIPNSGRINCIVRDARGFLWLGTTKGLCRYDGYQLRVLQVGDGHPRAGDLPHHDRQVVNAMVRMGDTALVLGTELGLWRFDLASERSSPLPGGGELSGSSISALAADSAGTLWIGTLGRGLFRIDRTGGNARRWKDADAIGDARITCLLVDRQGALWIGTVEGGLGILAPSGRLSRHYLGPQMEGTGWPSDHLLSLAEESGGAIWIGTDDGAHVVDRVTGHGRRVELPSPVKHRIPSLASAAGGTIWIAAAELGVFTSRGGVLTQFAPPGDPERSLLSPTVIYPDPVACDSMQQLVWIGTRNGLDRVVVSKNSFTNHVRDERSLRLDRGAVLSLCEDHRGVLWLGLWGGGLNGLRPEGDTYRRVATTAKGPAGSSSLPSDIVNAILEDRRGNLWIGTSGGLAMLDSARGHMVLDRHADGDATSIVNNTINGLYEDHTGAVWVCTDGGLARASPGTPHTFTNYLNPPPDARRYGGNTVSDVREDHAGVLWVATYGRGLNRLNPDGTFTRFLDPADTTALRENFIYGLAESRDGLFWLSTRGGLVSFDPRTGAFTPFPAAELDGAHIFDIMPDERGGLLLSTSAGLIRLDPGARTFTRFGVKQGLQFSELFSRFARGRRGTLYVGGIDGFAEFSPGSLSAVSRPPEIAITSLRVFDRDLVPSDSASGRIALPHDRNYLSFSFAALDYTDPLQNRFLYRMRGVDAGWVDAGTRNYATYPGLDPGEYVFEVRGCNSENVWSPAAASVAISIAPPYWDTVWFRLLALALFAAGIYAAYRYRLHKLLELERLRLRIADDLHDDVGSNLSAIAMVSREALRSPGIAGAVRDRLAEIYDTALATSAGMNEIVWFIKPQGDMLDDLLLRMKETASSLLGNVRYALEAPAEENSPRISIEFKRNFFLAFKEILTNIVRHAGASDVRIQVSRRDATLEMVISDNGRGFNLEAHRQGNGLGSLRSRAERLHGRCEITSAPGEGTTVRFSGRL